MKLTVIIAITAAMLGYTTSTITRPGQLTNIPGGVLESHALVYSVQAFIEVRYQMGALDKFTELLEIQDMSLGNIAVNICRDNTLRENHKVMLQRAIKKLSNQISDMVESIPGNHNQNSRNKRGLFNFVGILSHSLFGTIDEATFEGKLREYNNRLTAVTHSYTSSAKAQVRVDEQAIVPCPPPVFIQLSHILCHLERAYLPYSFGAFNNNTHLPTI